VLLYFIPRQWGSEEDTRVALPVIEINCDNEFLLAEALDVGEVGAATVRQSVACTVGPGATAANAVGIGEGE